MNVFELVAKLGLDTSEYESKLNGASSVAAKLGKGMASVGKVVAAGIAAGTAAVGAFAASSVRAGMDFDSAMSQVAATMGTTVDNIGNLRDFAQQMGSTTAFSATEAAEALNYMALAGYDAETSMEMLPNVLNLAAAGGIELAAASDMVTDAQTAFGLSLEETSVMVDQMAKASSKTNTSVEQLGEAFLTIGANAKNLSGGTEELSVLLGVLADNGIKGAEAGTHLRNIMLSLNPTTDKAKAAWDELGVSAYDAEGNLREVDAVMGDLSAAMADMSQQERTDYLSEMFNKTDLAAVNAMLSTTSERYDELYGEIENANGAAQDMANTQLDNLAGDITLFKSALEGAKIAISDQLTPVLRELVQFGSDGISRLTEAFSEGGLEGAMEELGEILSEGVEMVVEMAPQLIDAGAALFSALLQGIIENLPSIIESATQIISTLTTALIENLPLLIQGTFELMMALFQGLIDNLPLLVECALEMMQTIAQGLIDNLPMLIESAMQMILEIALGLAEALPELIPTIVDIIILITETLIDNIDLLVEAAIAIILALAEGLINALPKLLIKIPEIISKLVLKFIELAPKMQEAALKLVSTFWEGYKKCWQTSLSKVAELITNLKNKFLEFKDKLKDVGIEFVKKLWEGIKERWSKLKDDVSDLWNGLKGIFGGSDSKKSSTNATNAATNAINNAGMPVTTGANVYGSSVNGTNAGANINVDVTLEGDAKRLFRVVQQQAQIDEQLTGIPAFVF